MATSIIDFLKKPNSDGGYLYPVTTTKAVYSLDGKTLDTLLSEKAAASHNHDSVYAKASHTHNYAASSSAGGSAMSAVKLTTARTIALTGAVTGSGSFDGSANLSITTTLASHTHTVANISDLSTTLAKYSLTTHNHDTVYAKLDHTHNFTIPDDITVNNVNIKKSLKLYYNNTLTSCVESSMDGTLDLRISNPSSTSKIRLLPCGISSNACNGYSYEFSTNGKITVKKHTFDSSGNETISIDDYIYTTINKPTLDDIGAAAASHTHNYAGSSSAGGAATSAVKLATARTITLTGVITGNGTFDGSANLSITTSYSGTIITTSGNGIDVDDSKIPTSLS